MESRQRNLPNTASHKHNPETSVAELSLVTDTDVNILSFEGAQSFFGGYTKGELSSLSFFRLVHPADAEGLKNAVQQAAAGVIPQGNTNFRFLCKDDSWFVISATVKPYANGKAALCIASSPEGQATNPTALFSNYPFFNDHPVPMFIADGNLNLLALNEKAAQHYGYNGCDILGMTIAQLRADPLPAELLNELQRLSVYQGKDKHRKKNGEVIDVEVVAHKLWHKDQEIWVSTVYDITEQTKAVGALAQSELRYRKFVAQSITGIWRYDLREPMPMNLSREKMIDHFYRNCYLGDCNDAMAHMYGLERKEDLIGKDCEFFLPRSEPSSIAFFEEFIAHGFAVRNAISYEKDIHGKAKVFLNNYSAHIENGLMLCNWGTQLDITQQRADEESLAYMASIVEHAHDAIYTWSAARKVIIWNKACEKLTGVAAADIKGHPVRDFFFYHSLSASLKEINRTLCAYGSWKGEVQLENRKTGAMVHALVCIIAQKDNGGNIGHLMVFCRDISEVKKTEQRLKESEDRFISLADGAPAMIYLIDERDYPFYFNQEWLRFTGRTLTEEITADPLPDIHPDDREWVKHLYYSNTLARRPFEAEYRRQNSNGEFRWISDRCTPRFLSDGTYVGYTGFCFDVHERRKTEEQNHQQAVQLSGILNSITDGFIALNNEFVITMWNREAERIFGFKREDIIGKPAHLNFKAYKDTRGGVMLNEALLHKRPVQFEEFVFTTGLWCEIALYPYPDGFFLYFKDTTSRRRKQLLLELQKQFLEAGSQTELSDEQAADLLTAGIEQIFPGALSLVCIANRATGLFQTVRTPSMPPWLCEHVGKLKISDLFPEENKESLQPIAVKNMQQDNRWSYYHDVAKEYHVETAVVVPVISGGKAVAILSIYDSGLCTAEEEKVEVLQQLAALGAAMYEKRGAERQRNAIEKRLAREKLEQQRRVSAALLQGVEKQRLEMSRELHDNVCQMLASAKLFIEVSLAEHNIHSERLQMGIDYVMDALNEIRRLSHELAPPSFRRLNLVDAIKEHVDTMEQAHGMKVTFSSTVNGALDALPADVQLSLYRIVQEQTANISKYAKAQQVNIALQKNDDEIWLTVEDDGVGFDPETTKRGLGLSNIVSRAAICNGKATVYSEPGKGCKVEVQLPLDCAAKTEQAAEHS